jgi:amino acid adenylation domain-containing protein
MTTPIDTRDPAAYWRERLVGASLAPLVPADRPRSHAGTRARETVAREIGEPLCARLRGIAEQRSADLDTVLLAALVAFVGRYAGESNLCVGANLGGATVVRVDLTGDPSFSDALARVALELDGARAHGLAREHVLALLGAAASDAGGEAGPPYALHVGPGGPPPDLDAACELAVCASPADSGLGIRWIYDAALFDRATIERMAAHYANLLASIARDPQLPLSRLAFADAAERARAIALGRGPVNPYERDASIADVFVARAHERPDARAVDAHDGRLSYRELDERSSRLAETLTTLGVAAGDAVGVAVERSAALPVVLLAILKAGAAYVALDPAYPEDRLAFIVRDAGVRRIVASRAESERVARLGVPVTHPDAEPAAHAAPAAPRGARGNARAASALAYVAYTSGSTGRPKGVAVTQRGVVRLVRGTNFIDITPRDVVLQFAPVAFDASTLELWAPLLNGAVLAIPPAGALSVDDIGDAVERYGVTMMWLTTALFGRMVDAASPKFDGLRIMVTGGDVASPGHVRRFLQAYPACRLVNGYGPTENTTFSTTYAIESLDPAETRVPIGSPIANSTAYVLDEHREPAPLGVPGELYVGGDGVARGYVGLDDLTAERFVPDPFADGAEWRMYRTGDRVRLRPDGVIEFLGRTDDQVKVRGYRIELGEIEAALGACAGVRGAAVVIGESSGEKTLVAFVVPAPDAALDAGALRPLLGARLPRYMIPHRIVIVPGLPSHSSGKIDRVALARTACAPPPAEPARAERRRPARGSGTERGIADVWCEVLGTASPPGFDENFFDAGGDSLLLLVAQTRLSASLGVALSVTDLFEHTTIRTLAAFVDGKAATAARP